MKQKKKKKYKYMINILHNHTKLTDSAPVFFKQKQVKQKLAPSTSLY